MKKPLDIRDPDTTTAYWECVARSWLADQSHRLWRRHSDAVNVQLLQRWIGEVHADRWLKTDVIDEAFGEGVVEKACDRSKLVVGIDLSPTVIDMARRHHPQWRVVQADVRRLPFENASFDRIVSLSTLDHFDAHSQIEASLVELNRVLRKGGALFLTLDNLANPLVWLRNTLPFGLLHRIGLAPYQVGKTCDPVRLRRYLRSAGFRIAESTAVMHCPRALAVGMCRFLQSYTSERMQDRFLRLLMIFEQLGRWPSRYVTGYFVAVRADKPSKCGDS